ncbi:hypothetical protein AB0D08_19880 [Kitasatospora sp. NPDC048540]|uniref:hypothetical protein n=1 Tax=Kitasatospora sp. NPDC048540 TaxID=3155634 RepID=UPI003407C9C5
MAIGVPHHRRLATQWVLPGVAPALLPEAPGGERAVLGGGGAGSVRPAVCQGATAGRPSKSPRSPVRYDLVTVSVRHGLETVDILRLRRACGAVLQTAGGSAIAFLVPAGTADSWHLPGSSCTAGASVLAPSDPRWVIPPTGPEGPARPTDAWVLRSALCEAACTLTAGGLGPF